MIGPIDVARIGREILIASETEDALAALDTSPEDLALVAERARARVLAEHTAAHRARTLVLLFESAMARV